MDELKTTEEANITPEITLEIVKKRAINGVVALTGRNIFLQLLGLGATLLLTVFLSPGQFGIFVVVSAFVNFFKYFSDIGLAGALIQKQDTPNRQALETTFTVQNILVVLVVIIIFVATPIYSQIAHLDQESIYLAWALAVSLLLSSLSSIPSVLLERKLEFNKFILPGIVSQILYQLVVVFLAWRGFGVTSFTIAVLVGGLASLILMYILSPWKPGFAFDRSALKDLLRFGLPYQINTFLAVFKDDGMIMILGIILGPANVGLLGWAQKWVSQPLRLIMDPVTRVTFPAFSRMQSHKEELSKAVSKSIFFICLLVFPALTLLVCISPSLVTLIPKYLKWQPALLALGLLSVNAAWAAVATPLTNVLNATGKIKITFYLMIMWTVLTWILLPLLSYLFGLNGAALGYALVGISSMVAIIVTIKFVKVDLVGSVGKPLLGTAVMLGILVLGRQLLPVSWVGVIALSGLSFIIYAVAMFLLVGPTLLEDAKKFALNIRTKT